MSALEASYGRSKSLEQTAYHYSSLTFTDHPVRSWLVFSSVLLRLAYLSCIVCFSSCHIRTVQTVFSCGSFTIHYSTVSRYFGFCSSAIDAQLFNGSGNGSVHSQSNVNTSSDLSLSKTNRIIPLFKTESNKWSEVSLIPSNSTQAGPRPYGHLFGIKEGCLAVRHFFGQHLPKSDSRMSTIDRICSDGRDIR